MCLVRCWPEIWNRKLSVEVRAEVVHDPDGKEDVNSELLRMSECVGRECTGGRYLEDFEIGSSHLEVLRRLC